MNSTFADAIREELKDEVDCALCDDDVLIEVCELIAEKRDGYGRLKKLTELYREERD